MYRTFLVLLACIGITGCGAALPNRVVPLSTEDGRFSLYAVARFRSESGKCEEERGENDFYIGTELMLFQRNDSSNDIYKLYLGTEKYRGVEISEGGSFTAAKNGRGVIVDSQEERIVRGQFMGDGLGSTWVVASMKITTRMQNGKSFESHICMIGDKIH